MQCKNQKENFALSAFQKRDEVFQQEGKMNYRTGALFDLFEQSTTVLS